MKELAYPLTVYKASAGSGKTFTLAVEYIKLLVLNPYSYRNILAVTFTNKATEEMKTRILSQLYGIWKQLPDSKDYTDKICKELGVTEEHAARQSGTALHLLLHHYNDFRIETIDSFFQSVLRNLARELDLTPNLRIELNDEQIEDDAVDDLIEKLNTGNEVLGWIIKYINTNINDDKSWNVIGNIKKFGRNIFKEYYKLERQQLQEILGTKGRMEQYEKRMHAYAEDARRQIEEYADKFYNILEQNGLTIDDLLRKATGPASAFVKIRRGNLQSNIFGTYFLDAMENPDKWATATSKKRSEIRAVATEQLQPLQQSLLHNYDALYKRYASAKLTTRLLTQLRLLDRIESNMRRMNEEANRFLLSDTQQLLHSLIDDSDSPFIFEKIGTRLEHVMIDEFQDTSTIQWQNFRTLLLECMSHEDSKNLIVGDVKQSIYRWRSGDWRLLNNIEEQFASTERQLRIMPLETNYRSEHNIIEFNNAFFTKATDILCDRIKDEYPKYAMELRQAYSDVVQKTAPHRKEKRGLVNIKLLDKKAEGGYDNATMSQIADTIHMLQQHGARQSGIAILVRQNKHIPVIARYFLDSHSDIDLVSDEAFQLQSSLAVNIIINAMRVVANRHDEISMANLAKMYQKHIANTNKAQYDGDLLLAGIEKATLLPERFVSDIEALQTMPLQELAEAIYDIFSLSALSSQSAYICSFYDHLSRFANDKANNINKFLREWDNTICTKAIKSSDIEGVRIMSIHASKGLEYDHVIIPFCDWQMEIAGDTLWCRPKEAPYDELPLIPVSSYANQLKGTIYEDDYMHEHLQNIVDNLNLLYVGFTRASANLFVIGQSGQTEGFRSQLVEECLEQMTEMAVLHSTTQDFTFGTLCIPKEKEKKTTDNVLLTASQSLPVEIVSHESHAEFRQSNASAHFVEGDYDSGNESSTYLKTGSILHEIFSTIRTTSDIEPTLMRMQMDGVLYDDDITSEHITSLLRKRLNDKRVAEWFSDKWTLLNECTILRWDEKEKKVIDRRPDRVMTDGKQTIVVDFKFGKHNDEYTDQVKEYMSLLQQMGYPGIKGCIWYVYSNKIEEV